MSSHALSALRGVCAAVLVCAAAWAHGQAFPSRPLTLIVPWPAGGAADFVARTLAKELAPLVGQPVLVDNVPGAGGSLGIGKALRAPADGHTLVLTSPLDIVLAPQAYASATYQPEDARAIAMLGRSDLLLATRKDLGVDSLGALVALMKARPDKPLSQCALGSDALQRRVGQRLQAIAGVAMLDIPYNGVGPCVLDLGAGLIDVAYVPVAGPFPGLIDKGQIRALASLGETRNSRFPNLPLARESPGFEAMTMSLWAGLHVHAKVSDEHAQHLHQAVYAALARPELRRALEGSGAVVLGPLALPQVQAAYELEVRKLQAGGKP